MPPSATRTDRTLVLKVKVEEEANGRWNALVPDLPGLIHTSDTRSQALRGLRATAPVYIESLVRDGRMPESFQGSEIFDQEILMVVQVKA